MSIDFDAYGVLGIASDASVEDIKAAYRRAARRLHPDVNQANPGAVVQFQDVTAAYELLMNAGQRRDYDDAMRHQPETPQFSLRITASKRALAPLTETQVLYLLAEIVPDPNVRASDEAKESHMNLTLVLDTSSSMRGSRLDRVKVAAHHIIDQLSDKDVFSVVAFNDFAEVIIPAGSVEDKAALKARVSMMTAAGSTELFQGLTMGVEQNRRFLAPRLVNNILLITDGHTYADHDLALNLAREVTKEGVSISAMGLGQEWNDQFLDELTGVTGGYSAYIDSSSAVARFLNEHVRSLSKVFAERVTLAVAPDPDIRFESAFKLSPNAQPVPITEGQIPLGGLQYNRLISLLLQFEIPANMQLGFRSIVRLVAAGDVFFQRFQHIKVLSDVSLEITQRPTTDTPPQPILDALSKLTLYRLQERAREALENGDITEAHSRLESLATRAYELGETEVANRAIEGMRQVHQSSALSEESKKGLKYSTRHLLASPSMGDEGVV